MEISSGTRRTPSSATTAGRYVALRLALDHPERVDRLVVLDAIPIIEHLDRCRRAVRTAWYHWFFFDVPEKPERAINADPLAWYSHDPDDGWARRTTPSGSRQ